MKEMGPELYDFHARQYDPQIGRFWGIDPADQFPSGYTGMGNDPGNMIDPSGMMANGANSLGLVGNVRYGDAMQDRTRWWDDGSVSITNSILDLEGYQTSITETGGENGGNSQGEGYPDTDVFTTNQKYIGTINDGLPNQIHFTDANVEDVKGLIDYLNGLSKDKRDEMVKVYRTLSIAFIGIEAASELKDIAMKSAHMDDGKGIEIGSYGLISKSRQLTFTMFGKQIGTYFSFDIKAAKDAYNSSGKVFENLFSYGHSHTAGYFKSMLGGEGNLKLGNYSAIKNYFIPTWSDDYYNSFSVRKIAPMFINTPTGITLYNSDYLQGRKSYEYKWFLNK